MNRAVFNETWRQTWLQAILWGIGLGAMGFLVVLMIPDAEGLKQMRDLIASLPPIMVRAIGVGDDLDFITTPEGFIAVGFFGKTLLILAAYPVIVGLRVTSVEEHNGTMDILLSFPLKRWQVVLQKFVAYTITAGIVIVWLFVGMLVGQVVTGLSLNMGRIAQTILNTLPCLAVILAFTTLIGAMINNRRLVIGISTIFVLGSFMLDTVGQLAKGTFAEELRALSFFRYYDSTGVMQHGLSVGNFLLLLAVAGLMVSASLVAFQRRDVGV